MKKDRPEDVERGYYTYIHKDKASGVPFYVGKGKGKRAFDFEKRDSTWKEKVESLKEGIEVEIVKNDIPELEACGLEKTLIRKYGKISEGTGPLLNWTDGGNVVGSYEGTIESTEIVLSARLSGQVEEKGRPYKSLSRKEKASIGNSTSETMDQFHGILDEYLGDDFERNTINETDLESTIEMITQDVSDDAHLFRRRKISTKDFGDQIGDYCEILQDGIEMEKDESPESIELAKKVEESLQEALKLLVVEGQFEPVANRLDAENEAWLRELRKLPPEEQESVIRAVANKVTKNFKMTIE